ncbi:2,3-bisphosphoglycerate-independent phosphoglycerate mutase [Collinsella sp. An268]|uniref:2,3-bisphosphoglycerate-independent phosphoglycerate mutase n=1 Tax=Collinsella sp. An268 TaxID=1965612 RepID=UPI000B388D25|nr:2,3-bisphosphoglycerate-independent phosphoglycerate mutase [Collinsella sp. An268]OUO64896.1 phosphoglycerate mutase (2,3-diphosphoglycerate-independent) [Collinsella sp. An268]
MAENKHHLPALLVIMDGFGLAPAGDNNAVYKANKPFLDKLWEEYPHTTLGASGEDVGLPEGQMGNSEVGHLNIGAGRIVFQELSRINNAIKDGSIQENETLAKAMDDVAKTGATLHLLGLVSPGGVHSMQRHGENLCAIAAMHGVERVRFHCFMDGRDVDPHSGAGYIETLKENLEALSKYTGVDARIATVSGRYWAMDRDNRWERVERAYDVVTLPAETECDPVEGVKAYYEKDDRGDEFVEPFACHNEGVHDGDAMVFFNFRPDRAREMTRAFTEPDFDGFERKVAPKLSHFVTMTEYDDTFKNVEVAFPKTFPENVLADVIAQNGLKQLHTAETEKYAHVTFFLNGGVEEPKEAEERVLVPSPKVATYDLQPEMSEPEVTEKLVQAINEDRADFYIVNYANCDMVGHTGVFDAAVKAVEAVDDGLSKVIPAILAKGGFALITADHGNADHMYDEDASGEKHPFTAHTTNRVPFIVVDPAAKLTGIEDGRLSDIAPTMLTLAGLEPSAEMTGRVLAVEE